MIAGASGGAPKQLSAMLRRAPANQRGARRSVQIGDGGIGPREPDPQPVHHCAPELHAVGDRPVEQLLIGGAAASPHQRVQVAGVNFRYRRQPDRRRSGRGVAVMKDPLVEESVRVEWNLGGQQRARQLAPAVLCRRPLAERRAAGQQIAGALQDERRPIRLDTHGKQFLPGYRHYRFGHSVPRPDAPAATPACAGRSGPCRPPTG